MEGKEDGKSSWRGEGGASAAPRRSNETGLKCKKWRGGKVPCREDCRVHKITKLGGEDARGVRGTRDFSEGGVDEKGGGGNGKERPRGPKRTSSWGQGNNLGASQKGRSKEPIRRCTRTGKNTLRWGCNVHKYGGRKQRRQGLKTRREQAEGLDEGETFVSQRGGEVPELRKAVTIKKKKSLF